MTHTDLCHRERVQKFGNLPFSCPLLTLLIMSLSIPPVGQFQLQQPTQPPFGLRMCLCTAVYCMSLRYDHIFNLLVLFSPDNELSYSTFEMAPHISRCKGLRTQRF